MPVSLHERGVVVSVQTPVSDPMHVSFCPMGKQDQPAPPSVRNGNSKRNGGNTKKGGHAKGCGNGEGVGKNADGGLGRGQRAERGADDMTLDEAITTATPVTMVAARSYHTLFVSKAEVEHIEAIWRAQQVFAKPIDWHTRRRDCLADVTAKTWLFGRA